MNKKTYFEEKKGEPVFVCCVRGYYRGIVADVGDDGVLLSNPFFIFEENSFENEKPKEEYAITSDLFISYDAIEMICQPVTCFYGYEKRKKGGK